MAKCITQSSYSNGKKSRHTTKQNFSFGRFNGYGIYTSDTLEQLIDIVLRMNNHKSFYEKLFAGKFLEWFQWYLFKDGVGHYARNSLLVLITAREKYVKMYERFIDQLKMYAKAIRTLSKDYLPISLLPPSTLSKILGEVKRHFRSQIEIMIWF